MKLVQSSEYFFLSNFNKYSLNADLRSYRSAFKFGKRIAKHKNTKHILNAIDYEQQVEGALQSRDDNEDLFGRDLDVEELFGREYDILD